MKEMRGLIPANLTCFKKDGMIDEAAQRAFIDFLIESGVHGLYPCGTAGSGPIMRVEERKRVAEIVIDQANDRVPVMVHCGAPSTEATVELGRHASDAGAAAIGVVTPYYYGQSLDEEAVVQHYRSVAEAVDVPVFVYNIPKNTNFDVIPKVFRRLVEAAGVKGIKDTSGKFDNLLDYLRFSGDRATILSGTDAFLVAGYMAGCKGVVSSTSNVFPDLTSACWNALEEGNLEKAIDLHFKVIAARDALRMQPYMTVHYEANRLLGRDFGTSRRPFRPMAEEEREKLREGLAAIGMLPE